MRQHSISVNGKYDIEWLKRNNQHRLTQISIESTAMLDMIKGEMNKKPRSSVKVPSQNHYRYESPVRINKGRVLRQMEIQYKKVDPTFNIKYYISENEGLVEKHRYAQFARPQKSIIDTHISQLQRQIKTPIQIRGRSKQQTQITQATQQDVTLTQPIEDMTPDRSTLLRQRWRDLRRLRNIDDENTQEIQISEGPQDLCIQERQERNFIAPAPIDFVSDDEQKYTRDKIKRQKSPLLFLFWKFRNLVSQGYDQNSAPMKNLIDFYTPIKSEESEPVVGKRYRQQSVQQSRPSQRPAESQFKNKPQTPYQRQVMETMNDTLFGSLSEVEDSVKRQRKIINQKKTKNQFIKLKNKWEELLTSHKKDIKDQLDVNSFLKDKGFLKELLQLLKRENPDEDTSIQEFLE